ncbi:hypothetical protein [Actinokineospora iranica]|uniref:hypothetical protein n=1 Tax=Actinokineospora iranica TaxID=1271860 RepID=UPI001587E275|nr:hypothetical protein [Actinokineospora iranica]
MSVTVDNRQATVILAPAQGGGWHLAAVREGDSDATYAGKADPGSLVFAEPQIHAWYQLKLVTVPPLNEQAQEGLNGFSSGYGTPGDETGGAWYPAPLLVGGAGAVLALVLVGGALLLRRHRRHTTG